MINGLSNDLQLGSFLREMRKVAVATIRDTRQTFDWDSKSSTEGLKSAGLRVIIFLKKMEKGGCDNLSIAQRSSKALYHMQTGLLVSEVSAD